MVTIEAKTDESFGKEPKYIFRGIDKSNLINYIENPGGIGRGATFFEKIIEYFENKKEKNTEMDKRLRHICNFYFKGNREIYCLEYQLTHWFAGTIHDSFLNSSAKNIIMLLQQFYNESLHDLNKIKNNHDEYLKLIKIVSENNIEIEKNSLIGPFNNKYTNGKNIFFGYLYINI